MNRRFKTFLFLLLFAVSTAGFAVPSPNSPVGKELIKRISEYTAKNPKWTFLITEHFIVETDFSIADAKRFGQVAEDAIKEYALIFPYTDYHKGRTAKAREKHTGIEIFKNAAAADKKYGNYAKGLGGVAQFWGRKVLVKQSRKKATELSQLQVFARNNPS